MSDKNLIVDSFDIDPSKIKKAFEVIDESKEEVRIVDGVNILARVAGPFFAVNGESLNGRFYSDKLWEKAIFESQERMGHGEVLGTIGHEQSLTDEDLLNGKASHKVTKLWIDEESGIGMGEIQVLGTSAGKELNALLRGGVRLKVSSRATGEYKGKTKNGMQIVDPDTFKLEGFDFVQRPGIPTAIPVLVESQGVDNNNDSIDKVPSENGMSNELLESLSRDKVKLQAQLEEALTSVKNKTSESDALRLALESKEKDIVRLEESLAGSNRKYTVLEGQVADLQAVAKDYKDLGTASEISAAMDKVEETLGQYKEFGTPTELTEAFDRIDALVEDYKELGSPEELEAMLQVVESYTALGNLEDLTAKVESLKKYEELGTVEDLAGSKAVLDSYAPLGTPEEISKAFDMTDTIVSKAKDESFKKDVEDVAKKYGVKAESVEKMLKKHGREETESLLESLKPDAVSDRYVAPQTPKTPTKKNESLNESETAEISNFKGSLTSRLMEKLGK